MVNYFILTKSDFSEGFPNPKRYLTPRLEETVRVTSIKVGTSISADGHWATFESEIQLFHNRNFVCRFSDFTDFQINSFFIVKGHTQIPEEEFRLIMKTVVIHMKSIFMYDKIFCNSGKSPDTYPLGSTNIRRTLTWVILKRISFSVILLSYEWKTPQRKWTAEKR